MDVTFTPAVWILVALLALWGVWICRKFLPPGWAEAAVLVRLAIPVVYFLYFYVPGHWTEIDDIYYFLRGRGIVLGGFNPFTMPFTSNGEYILHAIAGGNQILYPWWNALLQYLVTTSYAVPVLVNTGLMCLASLYVYRFVRLAGGGHTYSQVVGALVLLHPTMVSYSSFVNLKDPMVFTLTVLALYQLARASLKLSAGPILSVAGLLFAMYFLRFWVSLVLVLAFAAYISLFGPLRHRIWQLPLIAVGGLDLVNRLHIFGVIHSNSVYLEAQNAGLGLVHMLMSPRPWALNAASTYAVPAAWANVLGLPLLIPGAILVWRRYRLARLPLLYLALVMGILSFYPQFEDYRERFQLYWIIAWVEMDAGWWLWRRLRARVAGWHAPGQAGPEMPLPAREG